MGDKMGLSNSLIVKYINKLGVLILNIGLKIVTGVYIKVMSILNFKIRKFKSDFPNGKRLENFLTEKAPPPPTET